MINFPPNLSNGSNVSGGDGLFGFIQAFSGFVTLVLFSYFRRYQHRNFSDIKSMEYTETDTLPQFLASLVTRCHLLTSINEYENAYNCLLERQLESDVFELDHDRCIQASNELQEFYDQLAQLEEVSCKLDKKSASQPNILNDIEDQTIILNDLLKQYDEIKLASIDIKKRQEIQISEKAIHIQKLKKQLEITWRPDTFFERPDCSQESSSDGELIDYSNVVNKL